MSGPEQTTPFTIITGFLGAGKTTLLNQLLSTEHGHRLAIIVNEFGAVNIDSQLISRSFSDGMLEMSNGCVCCTVQQDLKDGLRHLLDQREAGRLGFDHIILETTGMAKTGPIVQTIASRDLKSDVHLHTVITVVDALHASAQLDEFEEVQEQIGMADIILLNKTDLVAEDSLGELSARLIKMNAIAHIEHCKHGQVDVAEVLRERSTTKNIEAGPSIPDPNHDPHDHDHEHSHTDTVQTFSVHMSEPLDHGRVQDWLSYLIMRYTEQLLRYKGVLNIAGRGSRVVVQGIHAVVNVTTDRDWGQDEKRKTELVFIGKNLPEHDIRTDLSRCVAAAQNGGA